MRARSAGPPHRAATVRRLVGAWLALLLALVFLVGIEAVPAQAVDPACGPLADAKAFTVVMLPDTQKYSDRFRDPDLLDRFLAQTQWIVDNRSSWRVVFVTHIGDIVERATESLEWSRANQAMSKLDGDAATFPNAVVPYSASLGNHDYHHHWEDKDADGKGWPFITDKADSYVQHYGRSRYQNRSDGRSYSWYKGSSPDQRNHYQVFSAGGRTFLHLNLEWEVPGSLGDPNTSLGWAKSILDANPNTPTIISTHSYLRDESPHRDWTTQALTETAPGVYEPVANAHNAKGVFDKLVSPHRQVFMVLSGHWHKTDGEYHEVSTNAAGRVVFEMLANYQGRTNGGDGYLRIIQFLPGKGNPDRIQVCSYSPYLDAWYTDADSQFHFDLDLAARFNNPPVANDTSFEVPAGEPSTIPAPGVLHNDTDPDGDTLTARLVDRPTGGSLTLNSNGSFTYTPDDATTLDSFTYRAHDGFDSSNKAVVTIEVQPAPDDGAGDSTAGFTDIDDSVFKDDIIWLANEGITKGCNPPTNDKFCPTDPVTRAQMASFLVRALGLTAGGGMDFFTDDDDSVHEGDIDRLAFAEITKGCNPPANDRFCPRDNVTRGQMAAFLVRALGLGPATEDYFTDDDGSIFEDSINRLAEAGITKGCNPPANDRFCPGDSVTRGQMAAFLHRAFR